MLCDDRLLLAFTDPMTNAVIYFSLLIKQYWSDLGLDIEVLFFSRLCTHSFTACGLVVAGLLAHDPRP